MGLQSKKILAQFQPLAAIATTPVAAKRLQPLTQAGATLWIPASLNNIDNARVYHGSLGAHIAELWQETKAFVFCLAAGAVVRLIAPLLEHKSRDAAVVIIDPDGKFVISLCSGHVGGADQLARLIANQLGATPVLTGASNCLGLPGIDVLGVPFGWGRGDGNWTGVSSAIARGETVEVIQEVGSTIWQKHLAEGHPFSFSNAQESISPKARIWISPTKRGLAPKSDVSEVQWHPRVLWVGIGCERGTSRKLIETAIENVCQGYGLAEEAIAGIATIDIKADEEGILELCGDRNFPLQTFPADRLRTVDVPTPSKVVDGEVGTPSVAEAAALLAICPHPLTPSPTGRGGMTDGVGSEDCPMSLLVPKQIVKMEGEPGAVTVAIAVSEVEYTGRQGKLFLVGTGPGSLEQMTPAAQTAVSSADAVIGYGLYIDLIKPLQRPGQIIEAKNITQERERAKRAIALARWGLTVAVVSSGDCGIYGMAGLVLEELRANGWDGRTPAVQVFPGISALQAAASRVGTPLMHDFCAISLSDLLTPWEVIAKRLEAAAVGDFVTAIYNPRSQKRIQQIAIAQRIFLKHRNSNTPVAIVRSAYREDEEIKLTTLELMLELPIDMLTTVIIGNSSTDIYSDWMITPRGYLNQ